MSIENTKYGIGRKNGMEPYGLFQVKKMKITQENRIKVLAENSEILNIDSTNTSERKAFALSDINLEGKLYRQKHVQSNILQLSKLSNLLQ